MTNTRNGISLDQCRIASPCDVGWVNMKGDDRVRFCDRCGMNVYNLSALTRKDAEDLIRSKEGRMCVSIFRRTDGTILTADCPVGARLGRRMSLALTSFLAATIGLLLSTAGYLGVPSIVVVRLRDLEPFNRINRWLTPPTKGTTSINLGSRSDGVLVP